RSSGPGHAANVSTCRDRVAFLRQRRIDPRAKLRRLDARIAVDLMHDRVRLRMRRIAVIALAEVFDHELPVRARRRLEPRHELQILHLILFSRCPPAVHPWLELRWFVARETEPDESVDQLNGTRMQSVLPWIESVGHALGERDQLAFEIVGPGV